MADLAATVDITRVASFLRSEVAVIAHPTSPATMYTFGHIQELTDVFFDVLSLDSKEEQLQGLESKVVTALGAFLAGNNHQTLAQPLETLATAFESFLKKIAAIKYKNDPLRLYGDGSQYLGLMGTTLGLLLEGKVAKVGPRNQHVPALLAPVVTFNFGGTRIQDAVYERIRSLRNDVHVSRDRPMIQALTDFKYVMAAYFFALEENIIALRAVADPIFVYLHRVTENFKSWESRYVELLGQARSESPTNWTELQALEWRDESELTIDQSISMESMASGVPIPSLPGPQKSLVVADISSKHPRFWLLGEPGAGKSTTLQRLALQRASELLSVGYLTKPVPVFVRLRDISLIGSLEGVLARSIGVNASRIGDLLGQGMLWLLLDGLNEVPRSESGAIAKKLNSLFASTNCEVIVSSRRFGFQKRIGLPVYELLPLSDEAILEYLIKNLSSSADARATYDQLKASPRFLFDFAKNPMMLSMLIRVAQSGEIPDNRGQLFRLFMKWIFDREQKTEQMPTMLKEALLSGIAMRIRLSGKRYAEKQLVLGWIQEILRDRKATTGVDRAFSELLDNRILEVDEIGRTTFWHELILEYFTAVELEGSFLSGTIDIGPLWQKPEWFETIRMLAGLLPDATTFLASNAQRNIVLGAQCIASGPKVDAETAAWVSHLAAERTELDTAQAVEGITALLELGTDESLSRVVKQLSKQNDKFPLTAAVANCERPEQATVRLLRRGLTGRHRIFQCLSALQAGFVSRGIVDGPEVTEAQRTLLNDPQANDLRLIGELGISSSLRQDLIATCNEIIAIVPIDDARWRAAIAVSVRLGIESEISSAVITKLTGAAPGAASWYYGVLIALQSLKKLPNVRTLASEYVKKSLDLELFGLATRFIDLLHLNDLVSAVVIEAYLPVMARSGRLQAIIQIHELYPTLAIDNALNEAIDVRIAEGNLEVIRSFKDKLGPDLIEKRRADLCRVILSQLQQSQHLRSVVSNARAFGLTDLLSKLGIVRRPATQSTPYGFIESLDDHGQVFYHSSAVLGIPRFDLQQGMLVRLKIEPSSKKPGTYVAVEVQRA